MTPTPIPIDLTWHKEGSAYETLHAEQYWPGSYVARVDLNTVPEKWWNKLKASAILVNCRGVQVTRGVEMEKPFKEQEAVLKERNYLYFHWQHIRVARPGTYFLKAYVYVRADGSGSELLAKGKIISEVQVHPEEDPRDAGDSRWSGRYPIELFEPRYPA
jgi:hypothetical protein